MTVVQSKSRNDDTYLPLISVEGLRSTKRSAYMRTADAIGEAAREIGFFRICDHGIDLKLIEETYKAAERFFALPEAEKLAYYIGASPNHRGYVPFTEKGDYPDEVNRSYEAFDMGLDLPAHDPDFLAGNRVLGPNVWPALDGFYDVVASYYAQVSALGRLVCSALEAHLQLPPGAMTDQMSKPISQLRLLHYVRQSSVVNHKSVNMGAHTDYECLTLLHTRNDGLQVMTPDDQWVDVAANPEVLVVNIGDMMEAWTNGLLRSTPHRVLNLSPERYSLPYFVATNYETVITPFAALVGQDGPRYEPIRAGDHLVRMLVRDFPYLKALVERDKSIETPTSAGMMNNPFETRLIKKTQ